MRLQPPARTGPAQTGSRAAHPYAGIYLWTLQGWMAMFYLAAAFAKLTEPLEHLTILMTWPKWVTLETVQHVGVTEGVLALGLVAPLVSRRTGLWIMLASAGLLTLNAAAMTVLYLVLRDPGMVATNLALAAMGAAILTGRWPAAVPGPRR